MINAVIEFDGCAAEAIALYEKAFGATRVQAMYYRDAPDGSGLNVTERNKDWIMHSDLEICGSMLNIHDAEDGRSTGGIRILNVFFDKEEDLKSAYEVLKENGQVIIEMGGQFFNPMYCAVLDKFGVRWQMMVKNW